MLDQMTATLGNFPTLVTIIFCINILVAFGIVFLERKDPSATLAWICILFVLPVVGLVLYVFLSQNIAREKIFRLTQNEKKIISNALREQRKQMEEDSFMFTTPEGYIWKDMVRLNQIFADSYYTQDNKISIITDGTEMFDQLIDDIKNAKHSIDVEFFIVKNDVTGNKLINALEKKAAEGVEVRFLMDAMGSRQIWEKSLKKFKKAGGKHAFFFKPILRIINMKLNYRNHRKLVVIDDRIGYIGGFNIADEYLGLKKFGYWRDTHMRVEGGSVRDIKARFILDWRAASGEDYSLSKVFFGTAQYYGETGIQIVSCGPESPKDEVKRAFMKMITSATKNIYIQTPYFVPDACILESLKMAAMSGVDVRIMIPCRPDHMFVYWATYSYVGELIQSGCKIYIYNNGFLHAKTMVVDGQIGTIGSTNFDMRSFKLNFEANAFIYDAKEAYKMEAIFEADISDCHRLTEELYKSRSLLIKFKESISRLLSDLL